MCCQAAVASGNLSAWVDVNRQARRRRAMGERIHVVLLVFAIAATLMAQDSPQAAQANSESARPKIYRIAVNVQSRDPRVKFITGDLNGDAAAVVERSAKNVYPI